jgi:hypothetical protein
MLVMSGGNNKGVTVKLRCVLDVTCSTFVGGSPITNKSLANKLVTTFMPKIFSRSSYYERGNKKTNAL